ncbi:MAG: hypothetical protein ACXAB9_11865 [Candidatus Thorarchaeota archaeon]
MPNKIQRTSSGLRDALFGELDALRSGEATPARAGAAARLAREIISSVQMELSFYKWAPDGGEPLDRPLQLTTRKRPATKSE